MLCRGGVSDRSPLYLETQTPLKTSGTSSRGKTDRNRFKKEIICQRLIIMLGSGHLLLYNKLSYNFQILIVFHINLIMMVMVSPKSS